MNKKQRIAHGQGDSNINCSTVVFNLMFAGFHNQSPRLTMVKFSKQRETINLQLIQRRSQSPKYKFCTDCLLGREMVQVSQENDKRSIFAEYYLSETVLYLRPVSKVVLLTS